MSWIRDVFSPGNGFVVFIHPIPTLSSPPPRGKPLKTVHFKVDRVVIRRIVRMFRKLRSSEKKATRRLCNACELFTHVDARMRVRVRVFSVCALADPKMFVAVKQSPIWF